MKQNQKPKLKEVIFAFACYVVGICLVLWSIVNIPVCLWYNEPYNWWPLISLLIFIVILVILFFISIQGMINQKTFSEREE